MVENMGLQVQIKKKLGEFNLNVSFEAENEVLAILGASGCGKSMTLKCIAGIETPDEGSIVLNDRILFDSKKKINLPPQKRRVGYMFQDYALFPTMTVKKNIMAGMGRRPNEKKVSEYIKKFHLEGFEQSYPHELSGGQKQRVAMARMIAAEPELLLLDEPFAALDSYLKWEIEQEVCEVIRELSQTVLFVSHNQDEVYRMCEKASCIYHGKMEPVRPVRDFFHYPGTVAAALLSGCRNISKASVIDKTHVKAEKWNMILTVPAMAKQISAVGIRAHSFSAHNRSENVFPITEHRVTEEPFEWNVSFRMAQELGWLQWKIPKGEWEEMPDVPRQLFVDKNEILLLTE